MVTKKTKIVTLYESDYSYGDEFTGTLDKVIKFLQDFKDNNPKHYNFKISTEPELIYDYDGENAKINISINATRDLTSVEISENKAKAKKIKDSAKKSAATRKTNKEAEDLKEYKRLKKKFG